MTANDQLIDLRDATLTAAKELEGGDITPISGTNEYKIATSKVAANQSNICLLGSNLYGITSRQIWYVINAEAVASGKQWIQISSAPGGAARDITGTYQASPTRYFWSLYGGNGGLPAGQMRIPTPGSLAPGEFAFVPWIAEPTIYLRPRGDISTAVFHLHQQTNGNVIRILGRNCQVSDVADHAFGAYGLMPDDGKTDMRVGWCHAHDNSRLETDYVDAQGVVTNPKCDRLQALHVVLERIGRDPLYKSPPNTTLNLGGLVIDESSDCLFFDCLLSDVYGEQVECGSGTAAAPQRNLVTNCSFLLPAMPSPVADRSPVQAVWRSNIDGTAGFLAIDRTNAMSHCVIVLGDNMTQRSTSLDSGVVTLRNGNTVACELTFAHNWVFGGKGVNSCLYVLRQTQGDAAWMPRVWAEGNVIVCPEVQYIGAKILNSAGTWTPGTTWSPAQWPTWQTDQRNDFASVLSVASGTRPEEAVLHLLPPDGRRRDGMTQAPGLVP